MTTTTAVLIAGPTASGKSALALALAETLGGVIINADSMQIYREIRVLTARPSDEETACAPHRLYGHVPVTKPYSVARYQADATKALAEVYESKRLPIIVGGTGLYFAALTEGLADIPPIPVEMRRAARELMARLGPEAFHRELAQRDSRAARVLRPSDRQRVLRAYEVFEATSRSLLDWQKGAAAPVLFGHVAKFVLNVSRDELRERIDQRFRQMLAKGALAEAVALSGLDPALPASKILGLRELQAVGAGKVSLDEALTRAVTRTRQYAKRQMTWFRHRMRDWIWLDADQPIGNILAEMMTHLA